MKEYIEMIPVNDAFSSEDECPFCYLERMAERSTLRYIVGPGASYMEPDVRASTTETGFCSHHMQALYNYGNTLGSALILQSYYAKLLSQLQTQAEAFQLPPKRGLFTKKAAPHPQDAYWQQLQGQVDACFICQRIEYHMQRYFNTFFAMLNEEEFRHKVENCKGFCVPHFAKLMQAAPQQVPNAQREWFYPAMLQLMEEHLIRVKEDLDWLIAKYDYRNAGADWKNSRDALPRAMQKMQGIHPSDPPYQEK